MTRDRIVEQLFMGKNFTDCIGKMEPAHLRDDLRQEVILCVCEWPDEKVIKLYSDGVLDFFVARVIINHIQSSKSSFYKKYRIAHEDAECDTNQKLKSILSERHGQEIQEEIANRETREALEDLALDNINQLYWYDAEMLRLYMELGNYRAIQKKTGIPFVSCYKNIQKSIVALRNMVVGENKPVFAKDELRQAQNDTPKLTLNP
jgi:hypothetical protein